MSNRCKLSSWLFVYVQELHWRTLRITGFFFWQKNKNIDNEKVERFIFGSPSVFFSIDRSIFWVLPSWRCCKFMKNLMTKLPRTMDENRYRERPVKRFFLILTLWVNNDLHSPVLHSAGKSTTKALSIDGKNHWREKVWLSIFQPFNLAKWRVSRTVCRIRFLSPI